jgi:hypothetical protein
MATAGPAIASLRRDAAKGRSDLTELNDFERVADALVGDKSKP